MSYMTPVGSLMSLVLIVGCASTPEKTSSPEGESTMVNLDVVDGSAKWAIAIHGGAGTIPTDVPRERREAYVRSLSSALQLGESMLESGASAIETVEAVVRLMEDDALFNAGKGSVYTAEGTHELDASIMDGSNGATGAVAAVRTVRHPITLARLVMTETRHVIIAGDGAESFADEVDAERVENDYFDTERRYESLQRVLRRRDAGEREPGGGSTVGCVVRDVQGNLAAATSTGGRTAKRSGRVGDSPIVGAGTWADRSVAVSCTGSGEEFIRHAIAHDVAAQLEYSDATLAEACKHAVGGKLRQGEGGIIAVGADGTLVLAFNTTGMYRAAADSDGHRLVAIWAEPLLSR